MKFIYFAKKMISNQMHYNLTPICEDTFIAGALTKNKKNTIQDKEVISIINNNNFFNDFSSFTRVWCIKIINKLTFYRVQFFIYLLTLLPLIRGPFQNLFRKNLFNL